MPLPEPILDDLRFQRDLVDEARRRIIRYCPEWTDYNVSDPGITLIELFAWMTELTTYRLNRVPDKNYIKFLDLLDVRLKPPDSARAQLTFWLSIPFPVTEGDETTVVIPKNTEVATPYFEAADEVIFTTDANKTLYPPQLTQLRKHNDITRNHLKRVGLRGFTPFQSTPEIGDTFYLGFDTAQDLSGHILQLAFECEKDRGTGIQRPDPPLVWGCAMGGGAWQELPPSTFRDEQDTTLGFNATAGNITLYLPATLQPDEVHGRTAYWVRCRHEPRRPEQGQYTQSPQIQSIQAFSLGVSVAATHALPQEAEILGTSDGEPGQSFALTHTPVLEPTDAEIIEVEELHTGELIFVPWQRVTDFASSTHYDRHYTLELATGEVCFGPGIRQQDGTLRQYGRIPAARRTIRIRSYRHGGGAIGNVPAHKLQVLRTSLAYITRVTNLARAEGGRDQETLAEAKMRARREIRSQNRAVTAEDFESLTQSATRDVARVRCLVPGGISSTGRDFAMDKVQVSSTGIVGLHIVPAVHLSLEQGNLTRLQLTSQIKNKIRGYLDQYRLLTTPIHVQEPDYLGVKIIVKVALAPYSQAPNVRPRILHALRRFISPLPLPAWEREQAITEYLGPEWEGWPFGKDLYGAELFTLVQHVQGVQHVLDLQMSYQLLDLDHAPQSYRDDLTDTDNIPSVLESATGQRIVVNADMLLCSLNHEVEIVTL